MIKSKVIFFYFVKFGLANILFYSGFSQIQNENYCIDERIETVAEFESLSWDYCGGELEVMPVGESISSLDISRANDLKIIFDTLNNNYYAFFADFGSSANDAFWRLDFGNSLSNNPEAFELTIPGIGLTDPDGLDITKQGGNWYGFLGSVQSNYGITRLDFGNSLENVPSATNIGSFDLIGRIRGIKVVENKYLIALGYNPSRLQIVEYDDGFESPFTDKYLSPSYPQLINSAGLTFMEKDNEWISFLVSINTSQIVRLNFGQDLLSEPSVEAVYDFGLNQMYKARIIERNANNYLFVTTFNSGVQRIKMVDLPLAITPEIDEVTSSQSYSFNIIYEKGSFIGLSFQGNSLFKTTFDSECSESISYSENEFLPFSYSTVGEKIVSAINRGVFIDDTLTVTNDVAPTISFDIDVSRCITNSNTFVPSLAGLTSYGWNFGDGSSISNQESPTYQYPLPGTYTIRLDVNDGSCSNFVEQAITIYPEPPVPSFEVTTSGSLCSNTELLFTNTTSEVGFDDVLSYQWVIDGQVVNQRDTVYTFTTPGVKTITLQSFLPGCASQVSSQDVTIAEGPEVNFSYFNNCFGQAISFTNEVTGSVIASYSWNFGDGSVVSSEQNPSHTYLSAGEFTVTLSVSNNSGCETIYSESLIVNESSLVEVEIGERIENLPISFEGIDLTSNKDSIVSWTWNFNDFGTLLGQSTEIIVSFPGIYDYQLEVVTAQGCNEIFIDRFEVLNSERPNVLFEILNEACLEENIEIINSTVNAVSYEWDFCLLEFENSPLEQNLGLVDGVSRVNSLELVYDSITSSYYLIYVDFNSNNLGIYDFGDSLGTSYTLVNEVNLDSDLFLSDGLDVIKGEDGNWYGYVGSADLNTGLSRIEFGSSFEQPIEVVNLGSFGLEGNALRDVKILKDEGNFYVIALDYTSERLLIVDYGNSLIGSPLDTVITSSIEGLTSTGGFDLIKLEDIWYGFVTSINGADVARLNFGNSIKSDPVMEAIYELSELSGLYKIDLSYSAEVIYALVGSFDGGVSVIELGKKGEIRDDLRNLSHSLSQSYAISGAYYKGDYYYFTFTGGQLNRLKFTGDCLVSVDYSTETSPIVSFGESKSALLSLTAYDEALNSSSLYDTIFINNSLAPSIEIYLSNNSCITNANTFTPNLTGLSSYSWDFDGDNVEDSNEENPTFQFPAVGTYSVRLDVNDGTCSNFTEQEITIYPEPSVPSFDLTSTTFCIGSEFNFTNTTDESGVEDIISYEWSFGVDSEVATKDASFIFNSSGTKTITLTASIPGCETVTQQVIEIFPAPISDFTSNVVCENETTVFANISTNAISYQWDFGDGFASTSENPTHLYAEAGSYLTSLIVTDTNGCTDELISEVIVTSIPQVSFDFELACNSQEGVQFTDLSTVESADLVGWTWSVDGEEVSNSQNPNLSFETSGLKTIALNVQSSNGCESATELEIEILSSPEPDFASTVGCQGEISLFVDITPEVGNAITQWMWVIEDETYITEEVNHIFESSGVFDIMLEVTGENFCSETITKTIEVNQLPIVDFSMAGDCSNELIILSDASSDFEDVITSRRWSLDGQQIGNGDEVLVEDLLDGTYNVELEVETEAGCIISTTQELIVNPLPQSALETSIDYGLPGDIIQFSNTSIGGTNYQWLLNDAPFSTETDTEMITFSEQGMHTVSLVAFNTFGCSDTSRVDILIAIPEVDLGIGRFEIVEQNGIGKIFVEIQNFCNLPIELTEVQVQLENKFSVSETVTELIDIDGSKLVSLNVGVPLTISEPAFVCVNLVSQYVGYEDQNPLNNEKCLSLEPTIQVEAPYPNPVRDQFRMKVVLPEGASAKVNLINSAGKIEQSIKYDLEAGLNNIFIDMASLSTGIYFINIKVMDNLISHRIIKL